MKLIAYIRMIVACLVMVVLVLAVVSLADIFISVIYSRFYSDAAFVVSFGVAGVFAAVFSYITAIQLAPEKNESVRWTLIVTLILTGLLFFFFFSRIEGGEYEAPFKAFGITLALGSLLFIKGEVD